MLNKERLKNKIKAAREHLEEVNSEAAWDRYADRLAAAIVEEIKEAKIIYSNGLDAGGKPVIGTLNHTIE